jgi:hypothetical protein
MGVVSCGARGFRAVFAVSGELFFRVLLWWRSGLELRFGLKGLDGPMLFRDNSMGTAGITAGKGAGTAAR